MSIIPKLASLTGASRNAGVLIVEDSWNVAQSLKTIVEQAGAYAVGPVPSVREALKVIDTQPISLALVDMNLQDGFADPLVDELIDRGIPYAIITAYEALPSDADRAAVARMNKPLDHDRIRAVVSRFTGLSSESELA
ncbi:response regulator [Hyphomicrobium sp.]|uniref:response regulator n=1 Tax=Hyphomicrobium sp. TaxID=82 RepID=UPI002E3689B2|nr:response regulator [Hyphomicrobium sp.]HEX2839898.1 response regulator [Hyphomicrobium sp.]